MVDNDSSIFMVVDNYPTFQGGEISRNEYFISNIVYPEEVRKLEIQGTVFVTFIIEKDGSISGVKVLRGIGGGCDEEAVRVIKKMPNWTQGKQNGKNVRVQFNMPIKFILEKEKNKIYRMKSVLRKKSNSNQLVIKFLNNFASQTYIETV